MKWPTRTFVGVLIVAGIWFAVFREQLTPTQVVSPVPAPVASTDFSPEEQNPRVYPPISVELSAIGARLNSEFPLVFRGSEQDPVSSVALVEDTLTWVVRRGPIGVAGVGEELRLHVSAEGDALIKGKVRTIRGNVGKILQRITGGVGGIPVGVSARAAVTAAVFVKPELQIDWRVQPNLSGRVEVHRAEVPVGGSATLNVGSKIQAPLNHEMGKLPRDLEARVLADRSLRSLVETERRRLHKVEQIVDDPVTWLIVTPRVISASQFRIAGTRLNLALGLRAETRMAVTPDRHRNPPAVLPSLTLTKPGEGFARLHGLAFAPWDVFSQTLTDKYAGRIIKTVGDITLEVNSLEIRARGAKNPLAVKFTAEGGLAKRAVGTLYLTAIPHLDHDAQLLGFTVDYLLETRSALATAAAWLLKANLLAVQTNVERAFAKLVQDLPDAVHLDAQVRDVSIDELRIAADHLVVLASANADLQAAVSSLSF